MDMLDDIQKHISQNDSSILNLSKTPPPFRRIDDMNGDKMDYEEGIVRGYAVQHLSPSGFTLPQNHANDMDIHLQQFADSKAGNMNFTFASHLKIFIAFPNFSFILLRSPLLNFIQKNLPGNETTYLFRPSQESIHFYPPPTSLLYSQFPTYDDFHKNFYTELYGLNSLNVKFPNLNTVENPTENSTQVKNKGWRPFHNFKEKVKSFFQRKNKVEDKNKGTYVTNM